MRNFRRIIRVIVCVILTFAILTGLDYMLYPCTFMRNDIHTVTSEQRDVIIMGTSNGKMDLDPDSMLEGTGLTGHNLCVGGEYPMDSYYMMKLILEKQNPKVLVFELDPGYITTKKEEGNNYLLFYHEFPISFAKLSYFMGAMPECDFRTALFPSYEYSLQYEISHMKDTVRRKTTGDYDVSYFKGKVQEYHENGFIEKYPVDVSKFPSYTPEQFSAEAVYQENMEYMDKLIALCKENNVTFIAATMPIPAVTLSENWDSFEAADTYFSDYFKAQGVPYYNFNMEYYSAYSHDASMYVDYDGHMNGDSARAFSKLFGKMVLQKELK